jgi:hypothetical protein
MFIQKKFYNLTINLGDKQDKYFLKIKQLVIDESILVEGKGENFNQTQINEKRIFIIRALNEITRDSSFLLILSKLDYYNYEDLKYICKLTKITLKYSQFNDSVNLHNYILANLIEIVDILMRNLSCEMKLESIVYIIGKIIRCIFKIKVN